MDISWESSLLLFRPNKADLILITEEITGASQSTRKWDLMPREADRPLMAGPAVGSSKGTADWFW